jgi:hypothetical protein
LAKKLSGLTYDTLPFADAVYGPDTKSTPPINQIPHSKMPASNFSKSSNNEMLAKAHQHDQPPGYWSEGEEMRSAVLPLMLLRSTIEETLHLLVSERADQMSLPSNASLWIADELKGLLAQCHESASVALRLQPHDIKLGIGSNGSKRRANEKDSQISVQQVLSANERNVTSTSCLLKESLTGKVSVRLQFTRGIESGETEISDALFLLAPNPSISRNGVFVSLSRLQGTAKRPQIQRLMSNYTVVEPNSPAFDCVRLNDIQTLRGLLKSRQASPSMRSTENESLLSVSLPYNELRFL